ncbi:prlC [Mytilus edulis]|uniref:PrlC n=1 Tax=Mytilus edulis TaxID=6550 RepID=A0A8S3SVN8_MYTED|nr:prlC [Mytilus edulis]
MFRSSHCNAASYNILSKACELHGTIYSTIFITNDTDENQYLAIPKDIHTTTNFAETVQFETTEDKSLSTAQETALETSTINSQQKNWTILEVLPMQNFTSRLINHCVIENDIQDDDCYTDSTTYHGKVTCTVTGIPCDIWTYSSKISVGHPDKDTNYCRDPDNEGAPGSYISTFYIDPYNRKGKRKTAWMEPGRLRSFIGTTPFSYMGLNVIPPSHPSEPGYMTFHDVQELFENFGNGLQQMLTTVQYSELSGQYNIEVDAVFTVAKLMRRWLTRPEVLMSISSNPITGKPMSEEMAKKIIEGESSLDAYNMCYDLCKSAFDMECHVHPLGQVGTCIIKQSGAVVHYSTQMLAADIFEAFNEVGFEDDVKLGLVGKRFRETFLSLGGSVAGRDVFRKFRGRDPSIQPILEQFKKGQLVEQESATN